MAIRKRVTRDSILFAFGLVGVTYETLAQNAERPTLLILFGACLGLPVFLRADEKVATADPAPPAAPPVEPVQTSPPPITHSEAP